MSKRQAITMAVVALLVQATLGFQGLWTCLLGLAIGALVAWALGDVLNAHYRIRKIWKR